MKFALVLLAFVTIAGCAQNGWVKPDGTTLSSEDKQACHEEAYRKAGGEMNVDPFIFREDMQACLLAKGYQNTKG